MVAPLPTSGFLNPKQNVQGKGNPLWSQVPYSDPGVTHHVLAVIVGLPRCYRGLW
jgi:hypothetical protein